MTRRIKLTLLLLTLIASLLAGSAVLYARQASRYEERCLLANFGTDSQVEMWHTEDISHGNLVCYRSQMNNRQHPSVLKLPLFTTPL